MSKTLDKASLSETFIQFQIQVEKKEIQDFEEELCQLEDKKKSLIKLKEQLSEEHRSCLHKLQKKIKEQDRNLEQRQLKNEEQVENMARENLELKHKQEKELEELRSKLARLRVQVKELQEKQQVLLQYKNEGSIEDQQKIQKLEKDIAFTQKNFQEMSEYFQRSLIEAINKNEQKVTQSFKDETQLALERAQTIIEENGNKMGELHFREMDRLKKQVPLCKEKIAVLESTIRELEEEILDLVSNEFLAQSASLGSHGTHDMDGNIMKISPEDTSDGTITADILMTKMLAEIPCAGPLRLIRVKETLELVDRPQYSIQVEGAQQKSNVTASGSTTNVPPEFSEMFSGQAHFMGSPEQKLLWVIGKAYPLHPPPNDPADMGEETFDLMQTARCPVTTEIIHRKFKQSSSQSEKKKPTNP